MFNIQNNGKQWVAHLVQLTNKLDIHALIGYKRELKGHHINFGLSDAFGAEDNGSTGVGLGRSTSDASTSAIQKLEQSSM